MTDGQSLVVTNKNNNRFIRLSAEWDPKRKCKILGSGFKLNTNKAIVDSRLRPQSCCHLANSIEMQEIVDANLTRIIIMNNSTYPNNRQEAARIVYIIYVIYIVAWQTYRQTDCNTSLPLAGEVIKMLASSIHKVQTNLVCSSRMLPFLKHYSNQHRQYHHHSRSICQTTHYTYWIQTKKLDGITNATRTLHVLKPRYYKNANIH